MSKQTGKSRSLRVSLDYHQQRGWLYWSRWICAALGLAIAGSYGLLVLAGIFLVSSRVEQPQSAWSATASMHLNTGKLSKVHAHFEHDCQQCHLGFGLRAIASDAFKIDQQASLSGLAAKCQTCHPVQSHLARITDGPCAVIDQNCSSCHQEHNGLEANLINVASSTCTQCHANLDDVCSMPDLDIKTDIADFASGHPKFRSLERDPGRIKFSHAQHMRPGQIEKGSRGGFQVSMLPDKILFDKWKSKADDPAALVELTCSDCHKLSTPAGDVPFEELRRSGSATDSGFSPMFAPIRFEEHCEACHQLTFAGQAADMLPLPHAVRRDELESILSARLVGGKLTGRIAMRKDQALSSETLRNAANDRAGAAHLFSELVNAEVSTAVERAAAACTKCHMDENLIDAQPSDPRLVTTMIPPRWLQRGLFTHGDHPMSLWPDLASGTDIQNLCVKCHDVSSDDSSTASQTVMIKGPESCTPCHNQSQVLGAPRSSSSDPRGRQVVSDNCVLCHRFHWSRQEVQP